MRCKLTVPNQKNTFLSSSKLSVIPHFEYVFLVYIAAALPNLGGDFKKHSSLQQLEKMPQTDIVNSKYIMFLYEALQTCTGNHYAFIETFI